MYQNKNPDITQHYSVLCHKATQNYNYEVCTYVHAKELYSLL